MSSKDSSSQNEFNSTAETISDFYNRDSRLGFIRKVYSIFGAQTLTTVIMLFTAMKNRNFRRYLLQSREPFTFVSLNVSWLVLSLLSSSKKLRRRFPYNLLLLALFTIAESILVTIFSLQFNPKLILMSLFYTCLTIAGITYYSFNNEPTYDMFLAGGVLNAGLIALIVGQVVNVFIFQAPFLSNLISIAGALVFAGCMVYDTHLIVSGRKEIKAVPSPFFSLKPDQKQMKKKKKKRSKKSSQRKRDRETVHSTDNIIYYNSKEYILASLNLYLDFIRFFEYFRDILTSLSKDEKASNHNKEEEDDDNNNNDYDKKK
eukprot:gene11939-13025_t